jgi:hypothetical protein
MVNSLVWTAEEAKYLKAIFQWRDAVSSSDDEERQHQQEEDGKRQHQDQHQQQRPAGQFRILVVGGRGTGKTAILTRVSHFRSFRSTPGSPVPWNFVLIQPSSPKILSVAKASRRTRPSSAAAGTPSR